MANSTLRNILVTSAAGNIGTRLVPQLLQDPVKVILPTSNANRLRSTLPAETTDEKAAVEEGDIKDATWIEAIVKKHSVDAVFLCLAGHDELIVTLNLLEILHRVGTVKHLVFVSAAGDFASTEGYHQVLAGNSAAHVIIKSTLEHKLKYGGYPWTTTVLGPTLFFDNDLRSKELMLKQGFFDEPLSDSGSSRVSPVDIASVARNALLHPEKWAGKKIMIGSKRLFTGTETAKLWGDAIGKPVRICPANEKGLEDFEQNLLTKIGSKDGIVKAWVRDLRLMYAAFANYAFGYADRDYELLVECLGREPLSYPDWVAETGKSWVS